MKQRVVITGIGVVAPNGTNTEEFWSSCLEGKAVIDSIPKHWSTYTNYTSTIWAPLPTLDFTRWDIGRIEQSQLAVSTMIGIAATTQAIDNAGLQLVIKNERKAIYGIEGVDPLRCGVSIGTGVGGLTTLITNQAFHTLSNSRESLVGLRNQLNGTPDRKEVLDIIDSIERSLVIPKRFNPFVVSMMMPNACSNVLSIRYSAKGHDTTHCCACAAGAVAIGQAFRTVRDGLLDVALCGGTEFLADEFGGIFRGFDAAKTLVRAGDDPIRANCPFDKRRTGFLFSEGGSAMFVLESLEHAVGRGARIYAEIGGFAETCDGHNLMIMDPQGEAIIRLINETLTQAGLCCDDIDYINAHATGTLVNDETEAMVIDTLFSKKPLVNATKSLIGHTVGASGALGTAVAALSIRDQTTHVCKNLEDPIRDLNFVMDVQHRSINTALVQSFAFGGHNAALVLKKLQ